ncbi:MAG: phosphatase [Sphingomonas bacterium]|uniref:phosphatase n=1 Tax=Sphingomonas bacterium TaxID=1895847 RepID=UPI00260B27DB|nr:phosphatase [Sphingomonas bacterium]MDB5696371.1 phosphatase [Sphingomonas bacterium]
MTDRKPDPATAIAAAERRAAAAKQRLTDDLHRLQAKLAPRAIARNVAHAAADKGQEAARAAKHNPLPVAGAVAATGLFLLRHRIAALFRRKKKLTVPAQAKAPVHTHSDPGDLT